MQFLTNALQNPYVSAGLTLFLILYAGLASPQLPKFIADLFESPLFRLFFLFLLAYISSRNAQVALMVALAFTLTMNFLSERRMAEGFMAGMRSRH